MVPDFRIFYYYDNNTNETAWFIPVTNYYCIVTKNYFTKDKRVYFNILRTFRTARPLLLARKLLFLFLT